ncbi:MAG TPA: maleylpyruvate isomerase family mycothiol-dependent enzyme [Frankiaceae bacterium]|nr:maleylpyruvate isomerase family mycothiol-dependent enzyme [Frankiaceae bacterium]
MERERFLELLRTDGDLLLLTARRGLDATVPTCPGWTVRDAVSHTAQVYEHKLACIALGGPKPEPWPPAWPDRDPLDWYADAHARLVATLTTTDPAAPSHTWWPDDQTAGFWVRRMAQETAVHRADVESAFGDVTPIDAELAVDGVDEVLTMMLADDWSDLPQPDLNGTASVETGGRRWHVAMTTDDVAVAESDGPAEATVSGEPSDVLLWLWGRAPDGAVRIDGDAGAARRFRERLALATT